LNSYFRKFIENFAIVSDLLYALLKKKIAFEFGQQQLAFKILKRKLIEDSSLLSIFNSENLIELHCDASSQGFGAMLLQ